MEAIKELFPQIYRITFPYKDIFTTVSVIRTPQGDAVVDTASWKEDMENILFPSLDALGVTAESLKFVVITHKHLDHAGGLPYFLERYPNTCILSRSSSLREELPNATFVTPEEGDVFLDVLKIVLIPGHTRDSIGVFDTRSGTLVSGDCLQQYGIFGSGKWGSNIRFPADHLAALEKLRTLPIKGILSAHDFHPVGFQAKGEESSKLFLDACRDSLLKIRAYLEEDPTLSDDDLAAGYNAPGTLPTVGAHVFTALRHDFNL